MRKPRTPNLSHIAKAEQMFLAGHDFIDISLEVNREIGTIQLWYWKYNWRDKLVASFPEPVMTTEEAGKVLGCKKENVALLAQKKVLKSYKAGRRHYVSKQQVEELSKLPQHTGRYPKWPTTPDWDKHREQNRATRSGQWY